MTALTPQLAGLRRGAGQAGMRALDLVGAAALLVLFLPLLVLIAIAIKIDSRGPVLFQCRRVGFQGRELRMLKFRKMDEWAEGAAVTISRDARFTRVGRALSATKLDELPQLWNVLKGEMSLVGPRPEDPGFVDLKPEEYARILSVKPGITGLSQLAFAREGEILDPEDLIADYVNRLLPQKAALDVLYARRCSLGMDLSILFWTGVAVILRREVAVHRTTGRLGLRRRPRKAAGDVAASNVRVST